MKTILVLLTWAVLSATSLHAQCATAQFTLAPASNTGLPANQSVAVGDSPNEVAIGFFDADAFPDLATADSIGQTVTVRLGAGDGTFTAAPTISFAGQAPRSIVAEDFDEDGRGDLVVVTLGGAVYFLRGLGNGSFASPSLQAILGPTNNTRMIAARFAGDDALDLAISLEDRNDVAIFFGDGDGDFDLERTLDADDAIGLVAGNFSGSDTILDLAVVNRAGRTVTIFEGDFFGDFDEGATISVSSSADILSSGITAGDFNGDGAQELAVLNRRIGTTGPDENVVILFGGNNGTFVPGPTFDVGFGPNQLETADLNRDGLLDLAVASSRIFQASVVLGDGTASFGPRAGFGVGGNPLDIAVADLDGSGAPDLVVVNQPSDTLTVYLNTCNCLPSNQAPTAVGSTATVQQGSLPTRVQVATGTDPDGPDDGLTARQLTPSTIAVTHFANAGGVLSANVAAACDTPVGNHDLVIEISDGCQATTATLRVTVTANTPPIAPTPTNATVPFGSTSSEILVPLASDNGTFLPELVVTPDTFAGTGTYDPTTGEVEIVDAAPVGSFSAELTLTDQCGLTSTATYGLTVVPATTTTAVLADTPDPSRVGQPVSVSWSVEAVAPGVATPTGGVTVSDGAAQCQAPVTDGSCSLALTTVGNRSLSIAYAGDTNTAASQASEAHEVLAGETRTAITSVTPNPALSGQPVTVSWQVDVLTPAAGVPTGVVTVTDGTETCSAPVDDGSCVLAFTAPGPRTLTASYAGDARFLASQEQAMLQVEPAQTTTRVTSATPDPSFFGAPVTVGWSVEVLAPGSGTPTGDVTVTDGVATCVAPVGTGACTLTLETVGPRTLTTSYAGDANVGASQATEAHQVVPALTALALLGDTPDPSAVGALVTVTWDLAVEPPGAGQPTGLVTVGDGASSCSAPVADGQCSLFLGTEGPRTLMASYEGDGNFEASQATEPHFVGIPVTEVPTLSSWGLLGLVALLMAAGLRAMGRPTGV